MEIGEKVINRLSGPISFYVLRPKLDFYREMKKLNIHAPIFLLFGDVHCSSKGQCKKCECKSDDCCMEVFSDEFLKHFDSLSSKEYPVDIYVESYVNTHNLYIDSSKNYKIKDAVSDSEFDKIMINFLGKNEMLPELFIKNSACFQRLLKNYPEHYSKLCPTKNIRWMYTDIRQFYTGYNLKPTFELFFHYFFIIPTIKSNFSTYTKEYGFLKTLKSYFTNDNFIIVNNLISWISSFDVSNETKLNYIKTIRLFNSEQVDEFIEEYFENPIVNKNSYLMKEMSRSVFTLKQWKDWFSQYLKYLFKSHWFLRKFTKLTVQLCDLAKEFIETENVNYKKYPIFTHINNLILKGVLLLEGTVFLDLYMIARAFKKPKDDINGFLILSFTGAFHSMNIVHFLTNIMKSYIIEFEQSNHFNFVHKNILNWIVLSVNRCVKVYKKNRFRCDY
jgi:hypothetical protein